MRWQDIPFDPAPKMLRQFAGLCLLVFAALGTAEILLRNRPAVGLALLAAAFIIGPVGLWRPGWIRWLFVGWMILAFPIGWTVSQLVLIIIYYGIFSPIGILFRILGRDPLDRTIDRSAESYWQPKTQPADPAQYFKQF